MWVKQPDTPYHQQDTPVYCGAAVAQMLLESLGLGIIDQARLFAPAPNDGAEPCSNTTWYTSPLGLADTLNANKQGFANTFVREYFTREADAQQAIVDALLTTPVAPAAVVFGMSHWVVVCGLQANGPPRAGVLPSVRGLYVNDPLPQTPAGAAMPPPHSAHDRCGSGATCGVAHQYVALHEWLHTYFTGWQCAGATARNYAVVYDRTSAPTGVGGVRHVPPAEFLAQEWRSMNDERLISQRAALLAASQGIERHELLARGPLGAVLGDAQPREAWLVRVLDRPHAFYYLVALYAGGTAVGAARIDARDGSFLGAIGVPVSIPAAPEVLARVRASAAGLGVGADAVGADELEIATTLAWRPCLEFPSPYHPFYELDAGGTPLYAGSDGTVYRELTGLRA